jgi:DNA-binding transcriptional LysR family regulator
MFEKGLEVFLAIIHTNSFSKAAELLAITQSTVSHRLNKLEEELGVILVDRHKGTKGHSLTPAGESFRPLAEQWQILAQKIQKITSTVPILSLRIGSVDSVNNFILPPIYEYMNNHEPRVHLYIRAYQTEELYEKIENRELDVGFVLQHLHSQYVKVIPFYKEDMVILRLRRKKTKHNLTISASELDPFHELFLYWGPKYQVWHDEIWDPMRPAAIQLDNVVLISKLMKDIRQWALVPTSVATKLDTDRYQYQRLSVPSPQRITYMVTHRYPQISAIPGMQVLQKASEESRLQYWTVW